MQRDSAGAAARHLRRPRRMHLGPMTPSLSLLTELTSSPAMTRGMRDHYERASILKLDRLLNNRR